MNLFKVLLYIHIFCGGLSFIIGMIVLFLKKGNDVHKKLGILFYYLLLTSSLISLAMSVMHKNYFLFIVGIFTAYMLVSGKLYINLKSKNDVTNANWAITALMFVFGLAFLIFGIYKLINNDSFGYVLLVFGLISFAFVAKDYQNFVTNNLHLNHYLRGHIARMVGGYIAAVTAFLVVNNQVLPAIVAWLLPTVVLVPFIVKWIKKYASVKEL